MGELPHIAIGKGENKEGIYSHQSHTKLDSNVFVI
jgi:hypothetical protein